MTITATTADVVDARGLSCPMPIVKTATLFRTLEAGKTVEILATDPGSVKDFAAWTRSTGNELIASTQEGSVYRFLIRKS